MASLQGATALTALGLLCLLSSIAAAQSACDALLFAYFQSNEQLYYATSTDGLQWTPLNNNQPVLKATVAGTSIRDPFINRGPDGRYYLVTTNGAGIGNTPTILTYASIDLITWSSERVVTLMGPDNFPPPTKITDLWAPEWRFDNASAAYMVFWAARGSSLIPTNIVCSNSDAARFTFWRSWTTDFANFTKPAMFFDPGCNVTAPVGDGGIDGDLVVDERGAFVFVYKDARGSSESVRGIRTASSSSGRIDGPYLDASISGLLTQTLVEGPELVFFKSQWLLYFDCSFVHTPSGWPRPPYGVSVSPSLAAPSFRELSGSCTGNSTSMTFPKGATHGSFVCIDSATLAALVKAFPPA